MCEHFSGREKFVFSMLYERIMSSVEVRYTIVIKQKNAKIENGPLDLPTMVMISSIMFMTELKRCLIHAPSLWDAMKWTPLYAFIIRVMKVN